MFRIIAVIFFQCDIRKWMSTSKSVTEKRGFNSHFENHL